MCTCPRCALTHSTIALAPSAIRTRVASLKNASGMLTGVSSRSSGGVGHNEGVGAQVQPMFEQHRRSSIGGSDARSIMGQGKRVGPFSNRRIKHPVIGWMDCTHLLSRLLVDPLAEPHAGAASVFIDKLDADRFESVPDGQVISRIH
jgi:hypothetical protein